jgi:nucleoside-diphosphate-sugar epimerase
MTTKRALVTGATGTIGPDLVHQLVQEGWQVTTFSRSYPTPHLFPENVRHITGDITDTSAVAV